MQHVLRILLLCALLCAAAGAQTDPPPGATGDSAATASVTATLASPPAPPTAVFARDTKNDHGHSVTVTWQKSADDGGGTNSVIGYQVFRWMPYYIDTLDLLRRRMDSVVSKRAEYGAYIKRSDNRITSAAPELKTVIQDSVSMMQTAESQLAALEEQLREQFDVGVRTLPEKHKTYPNQGEFRPVGALVPAGSSSMVNSGSKERESGSYIPDYSDFYYRVDALTVDTTVRAASTVFGPVQCKGQWFNTGRIPVLAAVLIFAVLTMWFVYRAKRGADLYVRPLGGIEAVDDAIGRATEMGKPILYVLGLGTAADIATIASFTILGRVAKRVAEYQTELIVPCYDPIVMSVAQEVIKSSYLDAGRPDAYREDHVYFVTQSQFAYVAAVNGTMLRELPATNVYMGKFYAESLLLAETGALAGSIQISGTDEVSQIPFFVVACDYTLIGEELYAASAYLGREPLLLGSLKAQDYAKAAVIILAIIGMLAVNLGVAMNAHWLMSFKDLFLVVD